MKRTEVVRIIDSKEFTNNSSILVKNDYLDNEGYFVENIESFKCSYSLLRKIHDLKLDIKMINVIIKYHEENGIKYCDSILFIDKI